MASLQGIISLFVIPYVTLSPYTLPELQDTPDLEPYYSLVTTSESLKPTMKLQEPQNVARIDW